MMAGTMSTIDHLQPCPANTECNVVHEYSDLTNDGKSRSLPTAK